MQEPFNSNLKKMCLGNNPYQCSVFWYEDENLAHFKYPLPSGAKQENVKVEIDEDGNLLTVFLSFPKKKEGDTTTPIISMKFNLPAGLDLAGFKTAIDDAGVLAVTFTKLKPQKPEKKKPMPSPQKILGWLLKAVPICSLIDSNVCHEMSSGGY